MNEPTTTPEAGNHPHDNGQRSPQEAADELQRELAVRQRCFPSWVEQGRLSRTEARDRLERMESALHYLQRLANLQPEDPKQPF